MTINTMEELALDLGEYMTACRHGWKVESLVNVSRELHGAKLLETALKEHVGESDCWSIIDPLDGDQTFVQIIGDRLHFGVFAHMPTTIA